jgi:hypothetical protein
VCSGTTWSQVGLPSWADRTSISLESQNKNYHGRLLEFKPQAELPCTVAAVLSRLNTLDYTKG